MDHGTSLSDGAAKGAASLFAVFGPTRRPRVSGTYDAVSLLVTTAVSCVVRAGTARDFCPAYGNGRFARYTH
jgi:hypothetical protein